jgi:spermidine synthase
LNNKTLTVPIRSDKLTLSASITEHIAHRKTEFQTIDIYDTDAFGRVLTLDGHIQLTELDEGAYHEFLVHVPMLSVPEPQSALVVGGGDGGVLREICRHPSIRHIDMAEIDLGVVEESKQHLPFVSAGAFDDPRVHLHITDAFEFVKVSQRKYDLIVVDSTDVYEEEDGGISEQLFTAEFYTDCKNLLSEGGFVVTQADNLLFCPYSLEHIQSMFESVFENVGSYFAIIPSFGGYSGYCWGGLNAAISPYFPYTSAESLKLRFLNKAAYEYGMSGLHFNSK